jgi:hypothetical protein
MNPSEGTPAHITWTRRLEEAQGLDPISDALAPTIRKTFGSGTQGAVLRGEWLGHALHPVLTDLVIGTWTSATLLDLVGGKDTGKAAQRLVGLGLLTFGPTAWTGWAEWSQAGTREQRVGIVHFASNAVSAGAYFASWRARRQGKQAKGAVLALAGAGASGLGAYLGGHMAIARKVGSRHPAFADAGQPA